MCLIIIFNTIIHSKITKLFFFFFSLTEFAGSQEVWTLKQRRRFRILSRLLMKAANMINNIMEEPERSTHLDCQFLFLEFNSNLELICLAIGSNYQFLFLFSHIFPRRPHCPSTQCYFENCDKEFSFKSAIPFLEI